MRKYILAILFSTLFLSPYTASAGTHKMTVTSSSEKRVLLDTGNFSVPIQAVEKTAQEAQSNLAQKQALIKGLLSKAGIDWDTDITILNIQTYAKYSYENNSRVFDGYASQATIVFSLQGASTTKASAIYAGLAKITPNVSISWTYSKKSSVLDELDTIARNAALKKLDRKMRLIGYCQRQETYEGEQPTSYSRGGSMRSAFHANGRSEQIQLRPNYYTFSNSVSISGVYKNGPCN